MGKKRIKVLMSKIGLDGHDRGVVTIGLALRDAGMEVIYLGRHQFPEQIARAAMQEDPDIIGISSLADAHMAQIPRLMKYLKDEGVDAPVILGGFIQPEDAAALKEMGIAEVFGLGTRLDDIIKWIREKVGKRETSKKALHSGHVS